MSLTPRAIDEAYAACGKLARAHYENFPVASLLLPKEQRRCVAAIYAFAREADDFADEPQHEGRRLALLAGWRARLDGAARGDADHPIFIALSDTIARHDLPLALLHDLISAFEQDVRVTSYETFADVLGYCRLSANPVGRLVLQLFGRTDPLLLERSDAICTALQLTNFWQDVAVDRDKGRCYIPMEDMRRFGCTEATIRDAAVTPSFSAMMRFEVERTRALFRRGDALPKAVGGRLGFELRLVILGGMRVLDKIEQAGYDVFKRRPKLRAGDWGRLLMRAAFPAQAKAGATAL
jgi:phytoene synthase